MATAFALLKVNPKRITQTAEALLNIASVSDVYSISGKHDLLVVIKCDQVDMIEFVITDELLKIEGVLESETMFAFRSYDKREGGRAIDVD
jgi:DNA-binding Lrp family transcriptional regulator